MNYKLVGSGTAAASLTVALAYMALSFGESGAPTPTVLNAKTVLLGLALGWLLGILL